MNQSSQKGFTLIEVIIVVAIVAILAAIANSSYQDSVLKSNRADCKEKMFAVAQAQERHFTEFSRYAANVTGAKAAANLGMTTAASEGENCTVTIALGANNSTYTISGDPSTGASASGDSKCGTLTLTSTGQKGSGTSDDICW